MTGIMTFNSICPAWAAKARVASWPRTWKQTMSRHSAMTGFTLPGMIEEPGCMGGRRISPKPVAGPLAMSLKSLAMRIRSRARFRTAPETERNGAMLCMASNRSGWTLNLSPVCSDSNRAMDLEYWDGYSIPIPRRTRRCPVPPGPPKRCGCVWNASAGFLRRPRIPARG